MSWPSTSSNVAAVRSSTNSSCRCQPAHPRSCSSPRSGPSTGSLSSRFARRPTTDPTRQWRCSSLAPKSPRRAPIGWSIRLTCLATASPRRSTPTGSSCSVLTVNASVTGCPPTIAGWRRSSTAASTFRRGAIMVPTDVLWARLPRASAFIAAGRASRAAHERERSRLQILARTIDQLLVAAAND